MGVMEDYFRHLKNSKGNLDFDAIGYEELKALCHDEECSDTIIAALFDVPQHKVTDKRMKLGLYLEDVIRKDIPNDINPIPIEPLSYADLIKQGTKNT